MEIYNFSKKDFTDFTQIYPNPETPQTKIGKDKIYTCGGKELVKTFDGRTQSYISNKMKTLVSLLKQKEETEVKGINYPYGFFCIDKNPIGYVMPTINGNTLYHILNDPSIPFEEKKMYLKEIGLLLEEMKKVRKDTGHPDFFLNDLHPKNIMFDSNGNIKAIDVDSMSIDGNDKAPSMFLRPAIRLTQYNKYHRMQNGCMGSQIVPTEDTELYCYSFIILNFIFGEKMIYMHDDEFERYLDYLELIGYSKELTSLFRRLYTEKKNVNPMEALDLLEDNPLAKRDEYVRYKFRHK